LKVKISNKLIGENNPVFIVAEAGINHNGSTRIAKKLIKKAKECGADAIKFQTFKATDLTSNKSKFFKLFKKLELKSHEFAELNDFARSQGIIFFSTPFSFEAADLLSELNVPAFKIASGDLTNIPLIEYVASKKKPIIISTGMSDIKEIQGALKAAHSSKNKKIVILHSVSTYPSPPNEVNLKAIHTMEKRFSYPIGYSDNGNDMLVPLIAVAKGAKIIEKHFTLNKRMPGPDHKLSANPSQFTEMVKNIRIVEKILGNELKLCQKSELKNKINARRSLTVNVPLKKGTKIQKHMIGIKRPATGIEPRYFKKVLGKTVNRKIKAEESLKWKDIR